MRLALFDDTLLSIGVPYQEYMRNSAPKSILSEKKDGHEHINFYSSKSLRIPIQSCGMQVVDENILFVTGREKELAMLQIINRLK
jgi:hypothetical protein